MGHANVLWTEEDRSMLVDAFEDVPKLLGEENFDSWNTQLTLALALTRSRSFTQPDVAVPTDDSREEWCERDLLIASLILLSTSERICSIHYHNLDEGGSVPVPRASAVYHSICRFHRPDPVMKLYKLGREFLQAQCEEEEDPVEWAETVDKQYRELDRLNFDLATVTTIMIMEGLPPSWRDWVSMRLLRAAEDGKLPDPETLGRDISREAGMRRMCGLQWT